MQITKHADGWVTVKVHVNEVDFYFDADDFSRARRAANRQAMDAVDNEFGFQAWYTEVELRDPFFVVTFEPMRTPKASDVQVMFRTDEGATYQIKPAPYWALDGADWGFEEYNGTFRFAASIEITGTQLRSFPGLGTTPNAVRARFTFYDEYNDAQVVYGALLGGTSKGSARSYGQVRAALQAVRRQEESV